jgi:Amt family ammonium transporter
MGGLLTGVLANPAMLEYIGTDKEAPGVNATGLLFGNPMQLLLQAEGALFIIALNVVGTSILLGLISLVVPLRMDASGLAVGDEAIHGETAYALDGDGRLPEPEAAE